jgi:pimeloyl-ACP methyl ester carboxylesterase
MEQIRVALGEEKLNYLGISYGTYLGLVYADLYPDRVGRFIIDSAVDPKLRAIELSAGRYGVYESVLVDFMTRCSRSRSCAFGPNALGRYEQLLSRIEAKPLVYQGVSYDAAFVESVTYSLIRSGAETYVAWLLSEFERGDTSSMGELLLRFDNALPDINDLLNDADGDGMYYQVACREGFHTSASTDSPEAKFALLTAQAPHFRATARSLSQSQACVWWGSQVDTRPQPVPKPGVPPMMFTSFSGDAVTPAIWTRTVSAQWPGSVYVETSGRSHGVVPSNKCVGAAASSFMLTGVLPQPLVCRV